MNCDYRFLVVTDVVAVWSRADSGVCGVGGGSDIPSDTSRQYVKFEFSHCYYVNQVLNHNFNNR